MENDDLGRGVISESLPAPNEEKSPIPNKIIPILGDGPIRLEPLMSPAKFQNTANSNSLNFFPIALGNCHHHFLKKDSEIPV